MSRAGQREAWHAEGRLRRIEAWARRGYSQERIARRMGVRARTLAKWRTEDAVIEGAIRRGEAAYLAVEDAVHRMATGYTQPVTKHFKTMRDEVDGETGQRMRTEEVVARTDEVYVHPSITAAIFWFKQFDADGERDGGASAEEALVEAARALIGESRGLVEKKWAAEWGLDGDVE